MPEPVKNQGTPPPKEYIFTEVVDTLYVFDEPAIQDEETLAALNAVEPTFMFRASTEPANGVSDSDTKSSDKPSEK